MIKEAFDEGTLQDFKVYLASQEKVELATEKNVTEQSDQKVKKRRTAAPTEALYQKVMRCLVCIFGI